MNKRLIYISLGACLCCTNAYCLASNCPGDYTETISITGGTKRIQYCSQIMPDCPSTTCLCCRESPVYTCTCNSGYYSKKGNLLDGDLIEGCTCEKCPVNNSTCTSATSFSCVANYYKNGSACEPCPNSGKSAAGSTDITKCYLPTGTTSTDNTGTYQYTADCYYTK